MGALETNTTLVYGVHIRESANDGSDFTNAAADYRVMFVGEDGLFHLKDSAGTVTTPSAGDATAHIADSSAAHAASAVSFSPTGTIAATDVQAAIAEVASEAAGGSGADWIQDVNKDGTSIAGFTSLTGTWAVSGGTVIANTDAGAAHKRLRYDTKFPIGLPSIFETEVRVRSGGGLAGLLLYHSGTTATGGLFVGIGDTTNKVSFEAPAAVAETWSSAQTITTDTWYKVRAVCGSVGVSIYLDGTLLGTAAPATLTGAAAPWDYFALVCHTASAEFRNIKAWTLSDGIPA